MVVNPSTAQARVLIDALIRFGVRDAVLCPGSRSAPLAMALARAEADGQLRLHVRIDERSAGYLALGLAKASALPVPIVVTSGTAVANLHPAVVEASYAGVPLMVLSADRPAVLRGVGAPQTIDQIKIFGDDVRLFVEVAQAGVDVGQVAYWRSLAARAAAVATEPADPGPVHVNLPFAQPLLPDTEGDGASSEGADAAGSAFPEALSGREGDVSWISPFSPAPSDVALADVLEGMGFAGIPERTLVVVGDIPDVAWDGGAKVAYLADACLWPIVAEPSAAMHRAPTWLPAGSSVVAAGEWMRDHRPDLVISVGKVGLTRQVSGLLRSSRAHLAIDPTPRWSDPGRSASAVLIGSVPIPPQRGQDERGVRIPAAPTPWLRDWRAASDSALAAVDATLDEQERLAGLHVARHVWQMASDSTSLYLGSSWSMRQVYATARPRAGLRVLSNRGVNGIDGVVSSAWGAALAHHADVGGPTIALMGDLTFLHDTNGLLAPREEPPPPLTLVVSDNNGGGIFSQLEQGQPAHRQHFERVFGTPHRLDLEEIARGFGVSAATVSDLDQLQGALAQVQDSATRSHGRAVSLIVATTMPRFEEAALLGRMQSAVDAALS